MTRTLVTLGTLLLAVGSVLAGETASPDAPTNVGDVKWGTRLAEFKKARPNAQCHIEHVRDWFREGEKADSVREQYDMERGLVTTVTRVKFSATCVEPIRGPEEEGRISFLLEGNPPIFEAAYITYQRPDYPSVRQKLIGLYGEPHQRDAPVASWWRRAVGRWVGPPTVEPERLIWRRPLATVTLSSAEYEHLGRKSGATTLSIVATRP
jgi:hypothetical protein